MPNNLSAVLERITKWATYVIVALIPILVLPWTANVLDFNKQTLLVAGTLVTAFAWMIKALITGHLKFKYTPLHLAVGFFVFAYGLATIFSLWPYGSFWGWPLDISDLPRD